CRHSPAACELIAHRWCHGERHDHFHSWCTCQTSCALKHGKQKAFRRNHVHRKAFKALNVMAISNPHPSCMEKMRIAIEELHCGFMTAAHAFPVKRSTHQTTIPATWAICAPAS